MTQYRPICTSLDNCVILPSSRRRHLGIQDKVNRRREPASSDGGYVEIKDIRAPAGVAGL
ncbi:hypothetical protein EV130_10169 [Rhizobium azibense]|uniref:Uncharacterized protein n=1 Tax=Rhizobium azibense TaxID=1136135 RepID=A0A4R3S2H2_9HYPH|nr:hypothetical protein EV130_10169 [Rhizobium azibense]TCU41489.1 hypothetical protein EV129_101780 [Rhizobium azibense]